MPEDSVVVNSLAYRKNHDAIWRGKPPDKYLRILPHVPSDDLVLEIGAAEGVLSLLLAERGHTVTAVERRDERHRDALQLQARWRSMGRKVDGCMMLHADIATRPDLMTGVQTLVAVRVIYHLREKATKVLDDAAAAGVRSVLLCGNKNRAAKFEDGIFEGSLGEYNYYSTIRGMSELLKGAGYRIEKVISEGDPIVIGTHRSRPNL